MSGVLWVNTPEILTVKTHSLEHSEYVKLDTDEEVLANATYKLTVIFYKYTYQKQPVINVFACIMYLKLSVWSYWSKIHYIYIKISKFIKMITNSMRKKKMGMNVSTKSYK